MSQSIPASPPLTPQLSEDEDKKDNSSCYDKLNQPLFEYVSQDRHDVRNLAPHPLASKHYPESQHANKFLSVEPSQLVFSSYTLDSNPAPKTLHLINLGGTEHRFHVLPLPPNSRFSISYEKKSKLLPGMRFPITVTFTPQSYQKELEHLYIHCAQELNLSIPIIAKLNPDIAGFPNTLHFPATPINTYQSLDFSLSSSLPLAVAFTLRFTPENKSLEVEPRTGLIQPDTPTVVTITYSPSQQVTAITQLELILTEYTDKVYNCTCTGSCKPANTHPSKDSEILSSYLNKGTFRRVKLSKHDISNSQHTAAYKSKQVSVKSIEIPITKHDERKNKEKTFLNEVKAWQEKEKMNRLKWSTCLGSDTLSKDESLQILSERDSLNDNIENDNLLLPENTEVSSIKNKRGVDCYPNPKPLLPYSEEGLYIDWRKRRNTLAMFIQAARTIIIRRRMDRRLSKLKQFMRSAKKAGLSVYQYEDQLRATPPPAEPSVSLICEDFVPPPMFMSLPTFDPMEGMIFPEEVPLIDVPLEFPIDLPEVQLTEPLYYEQMGYAPVFPFILEPYIPASIGRKMHTGAEWECLFMEYDKNTLTEDKITKIRKDFIEYLSENSADTLNNLPGMKDIEKLDPMHNPYYLLLLTTDLVNYRDLMPDEPGIIPLNEPSVLSEEYIMNYNKYILKNTPAQTDSSIASESHDAASKD